MISSFLTCPRNLSRSSANPLSNSEKSSQPLVEVPDTSSAEAVTPCGLHYVNPGEWEYCAILPNTNSVYGVGRTDDTLAEGFQPKRKRHNRCARLPPSIAETEEVLSQLTVEVTQWKLGLNNPYLSLRDDVDHTDAILDEIQSRRSEHSKRDIIKPVYPLNSSKKYRKARKAKYVPHSGIEPISRMRNSYPFVPSFLHSATLFNRHANYKIVQPNIQFSNPIRYSPQFGEPVSDAISKLRSIASLHNLSLPDNLLSRFEDLVLFFLQVKDVKTQTQLIAILLAYYKTFVSGSVLKSIEVFIHSLFDGSYGPQSGEPDDPDWLKYLREGKTTWNILLGCAAFEKVSKLLSLCVTLGMCESSNLTFSLGRFKLFSVEAQKKHVTSLDLLDAFANTIFYFVEGGYRVFTSGSLSPLIYSDFEAKHFDEDCNRCERYAEFAKTGDLERLGKTTTNEFDNLLLNTIDKGNQLLNMTSSVSEKAVFRSRLDRLRRIQTELIQTRLSSGLRTAPFVVSFYGGSSQGKSSIAKIFMTTLLEANGFPSTPAYVCSVNENDKFLSTYRSCVNGVFVDDIGNAKADFVDRPPSQILIDLNNNVPTYALQAEADKKGKVVIEPKIVVCTSNVKDLGGNVYSNEPVSIARRADLHITTSVKPEFSTNGMLDSTKVWRAFPSGDVPIQDIWNLTVQVVVAVRSPSSNGKDSIGWQTVQVGDKYLADVGVEEALRYAVQLSRQHRQDQLRLVEEANSLQTRLNICRTCGMPDMYCKCIPVEVLFPGQQGSKFLCECTDTTVCYECCSHSEKELICDLCDRITPTSAMVEHPDYSLYLATHCYCKCFNKHRHVGEYVFSVDSSEPKKYEEQFGSILSSTILGFSWKWYTRSSAKFGSLSTRLEEYATARLFEFARDLEKSWVSRWTNWIPRTWLKQQWCEQIVCYMERDSIMTYASSQISSICGCAAIGASMMMWNRPLPVVFPFVALGLWSQRKRVPTILPIPIMWFSAGAPILTIPASYTISALSSIAVSSFLLNIPQFHFSRSTIFGIAVCISMLHLQNFLMCRENVFQEILRRNDAIPAMVASVRENQMKIFLKYCAIAGAIYTVCKIWSHLRVIPEEQGNLEPLDLSDIEERDAESNPWSIPDVKPLPCTLKSKSVTHSVLCDLVFNNLAHMTCVIDGKRNSCDAFFPFSNVAIIPNHAWKQDVLEVKFTRKDPTCVGANFSCFISKLQSIHIPNTDFCLVWIPNGGDWKDLRPYFPTGELRQVYATLIYKDREGKRVDGATIAIYGDTSTGACQNFRGCSYVLPFKTFRGLCMAPLVSQTNGPMIAGFHLGGVESSPQGCAGFLTIQELDRSIAELSAIPGVLLSKSEGAIKKVLYDVQWFESSQIHTKSPLNYLPCGTNCTLYGSCIGRAKYFSEVIPLPISPTVAEIMGVPPKWGKPKFSTASWRESLVYSCDPSIGVEPHLLSKAYDDYILQLDTILLNPRWKSLIDDTKPLTNMQTVCGIDGRRFIDKMPSNTSVGYPLSGPKSQYIELLDSTDFPDFNCPAVIDNRFWEEWYECEQKYLNGYRAYPVFKACLKDEPTPIDKDKVRVFQASPIALQLGIRKYYLPLARILSCFPLISECAVGINAQSPEWHQLMTHVGRFGDSTTLAGDYSKYDLRMPAQLTLAAFRVLLHIAQRCGYTEYDIIVMTGIATDVCYPLVAYNGDIVQHFGSNPSGQNLTVYINCIVNSLLFRCGAIHILGNRYSRFNEICSLITYGDDADGTVHSAFPEFNHLTYAKFLGERGMVFTMPDKKRTPTEYMTRKESHFLKRESKILGDTNLLCGALEEDSIFKSLHCVLKSRAVTTMEQSICNIDGAAREFFFHGPEVYETRRLQLIEVAERHNLRPLCPGLELTFDDRLTKWKEQYVPGFGGIPK